jgi:tetratricopeptide (TPR) repeat protein
MNDCVIQVAIYRGQKHSGRAIEETLRAAEVLAFIDYGSDPERLAFGALRTLNVAESSDYAPGIVLGSTGIGLMCDAFGLAKLARHYHQRAVAVAESIAQPLAIGNAYLGLAIHEAHAMGDGAAAEGHYRTSYEAYRQTGDVKRACGTIAVWCYRLRFRGDFEAVRARGVEIMQAGSNGADEQLKLWGAVLIGVALVDLGDLAGAEPHIRSAIEIANAISDHRSIVTSGALLGFWHLRRGEVDDAISMLEMADRISHERRIRQFHATMALTTLVEAYLAAAERGDRERWLRKARDASKASVAHGKVDRQALPGAYRWRGSYEWLRGNQVAARKWWDRSASVATTLGGLRDLNVTREERARLESLAEPSG